MSANMKMRGDHPRDGLDRWWYDHGLKVLGIGFVLCVIIYLVSMAMKYRDAVDVSRRMATLAQLSNLVEALNAFRADMGRYPTSVEGLEALIHAPSDAAHWKSRYIPNVPSDYWNRPYIYAQSESTTFDLRSAGRDGIAGTNDDLLAPKTASARPGSPAP